jgi:hypothetical protein
MKLYKGSKFLITVRPKLTAANVIAATTANDLVFNWTAFRFPKYPFAAKLTSVTAMVAGGDVTRVEEPFELYFAQPNPDGTAPPKLGVEHDVVSALEGGYYRNLLGSVSILEEDFDDHIPFNAFAQISQARNAVADIAAPGMILGSESLTSDNGQDTHTHLYVAGISSGTVIQGTNVDLNQSGHQAATTTSTTIIVDTDPRKVFSIGDTIHAADGAEVGVLTGFGDAAGADKATKLTFGGGISEALTHQDELINLQPLTFRFGFEA